jgi:transcriptional regulator with XRE-family HTH domain
MTLGKRIEAQMLALGLSQAELARRAAVPQTTMNGLIRGSSRTTPHLIRIAHVLDTTPAYLMGETDNPKAQYAEVSLSAAELDLIRMYREIDIGGRSIVEVMARKLYELSIREKIEQADHPDEFDKMTYLQCIAEELTPEEKVSRIRERAKRLGEPVDETMIRRILESSE